MVSSVRYLAGSARAHVKIRESVGLSADCAVVGNLGHGRVPFT